MVKIVEENLVIAGPAGDLEAVLADPGTDSIYHAVICHPHPLHGGTLGNKVVHYAARAVTNMGIPAMRFNFRGVGKSAGNFDNARGEGDDLASVAGWMAGRYPRTGLVLVGFSFGAYVAASRAADLGAAALITIAPPVNLYDFSRIPVPECPWFVIIGDEDEVVPPEAVARWAKTSVKPELVHWMAGASHFFHGRLPELAGVIRDWLEKL